MNTDSRTSETLYLPLAHTTRPFSWEVFHETHRMGAFSTQDECFRHALRLAESIGKHSGHRVRVKVEDENGMWETVDVFLPETLSA